MAPSESPVPGVLLAVLLLTLVLLIAGWDIYAAFSGHGEHTVSAIIAGWSDRRPILPFVLGMVVGHAFWGQWHDGPRLG